MILARLLPAVLALAAVQREGLTEYELKARMVVLMPSFVRWPSHAGPFTVAVLGDADFTTSLQLTALTWLQGGRDMKIRYTSRPEEALSADILYIPASERYRLKELLRSVRGRPVLTVGDGDGYARDGVMVNLYRDGSRVRLEVNLKAVKDSGLEVSSQMLAHCRVLEQGPAPSP